MTHEESVKAMVLSEVKRRGQVAVCADLRICRQTLLSYLAGTGRESTAALVEKRVNTVETFAASHRGKSLGISYL